MRKRVIFFIQVISLIFTIFASSWVHGDSVVASRFYEVPVEITFNPSDEAFNNIYSKAALAASWFWSDEGADCDGDMGYPLNYGTQGLMKGRSKRVPYKEPYTTILKVGYAKKYVGYLGFHLSIVKERISINPRQFMTIPIKKGEREFNVVDGRGFSWGIKTKTLDEKARFVEVPHQLWP